jgi:integrase
MAVQRITKRLVDSLEGKERYYFVWDVDLTGFGVRVWPSGRKTYLARYRLPGEGRKGMSKRISLGEHGTVTPDEARQLARKALGSVAHGRDPVAERSARRQAPTVKELGEDFLKDAETRTKPTTFSEYVRLWHKHVLPAIGTKQVPAIETADIRKLHRSLSETPYVANRVVARLHTFFEFAESEKVRPRHSNPVEGLDLFPEQGRERFLSVAEYQRLGAALIKAETVGLPPAPKKRRKPSTNPATQKHRPKVGVEIPFTADPYGVAAIRLITLTGWRKTEALSIEDSLLDLERGHVRFSDTKTGRQSRRISQTVIDFLKTIPRIEGNPHFFPGLKGKGCRKTIDRLWHAVRHAAGLDDVRLHDLRHSFASVPASAGTSLLIIRELLGHKNVATTERYSHLANDPVKEAAEKTSADIARWLGKEIRTSELADSAS